MSVECLLARVGRVPEVVRVEAAIGRSLNTFLSTSPAEHVNSPPHVHIVPKLRVSNDHFTHALSVIFIGTPELFAAIRSFSLFINILIWPEGAIVVVEYDVFVRLVERVAVLPVRVCHPKLFP